MKIEVVSCDDDGNVELDLDDEGQAYLIKLGFEALLNRAMCVLKNEVEANEANR